MRKQHWLRLGLLSTLQVEAFVHYKKGYNSYHLGSTVPMSSSSSLYEKKESVAIIGGGIAGLSCAHFLGQSSKFVPTVYDTGRLRPGGRCSSRMPNDRLADNQSRSNMYQPDLIVDHTAQILTVPQRKGFGEFEKQVKEWEKQGLLTAYPDNTVCDILDDGEKDDAQNGSKKNQANAFRLEPINGKNAKQRMYYGTEGMGSIPLAMSRQSSSNFELEQDVWVAPSNGVRYMENQKQKWKLQAKGQVLGTYDRIIIAHNGKCADRITSRTPARKINSLLKVNFAPTVQKWGGKKMTLNSIYSLTFSLDSENSVLAEALPKDKFVCGFIRNNPGLRFISCHSRKYQNDDSNEEVWTLFSSPTFAKKYKAPQEFLPDEVVTEVTNLMMRNLEKSLHLRPGSLGLGLDDKNIRSKSRLQLWGAAVPLNTWRSSGDSQPKGGDDGGFLYDGDFSIGVCGDWLLDASIGGAWESGRRLAQFMITNDGSASAGLEGKFQRSAASHKGGLGSFVTSK